MSGPKPKVLFLCTHNSARSQMAEAYLRHYAGDHYDVFSAGLDPQGIHPLTEQVMAEAGFSLEGQSSTNVSEYLGQYNFGWLITVCNYAEQHCPTAFLGLSNRIHWADLEDPGKFEGSDEQRIDFYRTTRDRVSEHVRHWLAEQGLSVA